MKRHLTTGVLTVAFIGATLFLFGCSTVESRISEHPEVYHSLPGRQQALVANGQIVTGMPREAVYLAWGSPDQRVQGMMRGDLTETWVYVHYTYAYPGYGYGYGYPYGYGYGYGGFGLGFGGVVATHHHHGHSFAFVGSPYYDPFYYSYIPPSIPYPYRTVTFANGRVMSFQSLVGY